MEHLTMEQLENGLSEVVLSPKDDGGLEMIVRRPEVDKREVLEVGMLDIDEGLIGDTWRNRPSSRTKDGSAHPEMQLNIMNARVIDLLAQDRERWQWAGDQLFLDLDLSRDNLPTGTQLSIGSAIIEVTAIPHTGCKKFVARYGLDAMKFVNARERKDLRLRGINAKVIQGGTIRVGDLVKKLNH